MGDIWRIIFDGLRAYSVDKRLKSTHNTGNQTNGIRQRQAADLSEKIHVVLATSIPEEKCRQINLGYLDPARINIENYGNREEEGFLYVDHAGEILYKLQARAIK